MQEEMEWERKGKTNGQVEPKVGYENILFEDINLGRDFPDTDRGEHPELASAKKELELTSVMECCWL